MKQVDLIGLRLEAGSGMPLMLLQEIDEPRRVLPVVIGRTEANSIALALSGTHPPRPMTHDLMANVLDKLGSRVHAVEVTELTDGTFHAALVLESPEGSHRIDTRPSDAVALAVRKGAPIFAAEAVLEEAGAVIEGAVDESDPQSEPDPELDPDRIEAEVAAFRQLLDGLDDLDALRDAGGDEPAATEDPDTPGEGGDE